MVVGGYGDIMADDIVSKPPSLIPEHGYRIFDGVGTLPRLDFLPNPPLCILIDLHEFSCRCRMLPRGISVFTGFLVRSP